MRAIKTTTISILAIGLLAGSAVGVTAQDEEEAAGVTSFTGSVGTEGDVARDATEVALPDGFSAGNDFTWLSRWESSDPRLTGDTTSVINGVMDPDGFTAWETGDVPNALRSSIIELTNDAGSWLGESTGFSSTDLGVDAETVIFVGQDGYEGLTAYVLVDSTQFPATYSGVIFPTAMPPFPELPAAE